jgi:hypothetical protein
LPPAFQPLHLPAEISNKRIATSNWTVHDLLAVECYQCTQIQVYESIFLSSSWQGSPADFRQKTPKPRRHNALLPQKTAARWLVEPPATHPLRY